MAEAQPAPAGEPDPPEDALARLRESVQRTREAAEAFAAAQPPPDPGPDDPGEAETAPDTETETGRGGGEPPQGDMPPPRGWSVPGSESSAPLQSEIQAIVTLLESLRTIIPPELQQQFAQVLRELLLAIRALIDWYLDRIDRRPRTSAPVEDIPID